MISLFALICATISDGWLLLVWFVPTAIALVAIAMCYQTASSTLRSRSWFWNIGIVAILVSGGALWIWIVDLPSTPGILIGILATGFLWRRLVTASQQGEFLRAELISQSRIDLVMVFGLIVLAIVYAIHPNWEVRIIPLFFLAGWLRLYALMSITRLEQHTAVGTDAVRRASVGLAIFGWVTGGILLWLAQSWGFSILGAIGRMIQLLLTPVVQWFVAFFPSDSSDEIQESPLQREGEEPEEDLIPVLLEALYENRLDAGIADVVNGALILIVIALVLWWVIRRLTPQYHSRLLLQTVEERQFIRKSATSPSPTRPPSPPTSGIRRLYWEVLMAFRAAGNPRSPDETAVEWSSRVSRQKPALRDDLSILTRSYMNARYGRQKSESVEKLEKIAQRLKQEANNDH
jgi:hypothetical protein